MITARVRLVSSMWFRLPDTNGGATVEELLVYNLRPLEGLSGDEQIVDDETIVGIVMVIDFDGLLYRLMIDSQTFADTRAIVEDIVTSQWATVCFDDNGRMLAVNVTAGEYKITVSELIGLSTTIDRTDGSWAEGVD